MPLLELSTWARDCSRVSRQRLRYFDERRIGLSMAEEENVVLSVRRWPGSTIQKEWSLYAQRKSWVEVEVAAVKALVHLKLSCWEEHPMGLRARQPRILGILKGEQEVSADQSSPVDSIVRRRVLELLM